MSSPDDNEFPVPGTYFELKVSETIYLSSIRPVPTRVRFFGWISGIEWLGLVYESNSRGTWRRYPEGIKVNLPLTEKVTFVGDCRVIPEK